MGTSNLNFVLKSIALICTVILNGHNPLKVATY